MPAKDQLQLVFAGTPQLAATILSALLKQQRHALSAVISQPDRPAGRGRIVVASPVKQLAEKHGLPIRQPATPDMIDPDNTMAEVDVLVVAAFGMILPAEILHRPRLGCINVHTSLLPRWRGAAPIQRAIQAGDSKTGVTIMQIEQGLDQGDILLQKECAILPDDTGGSLLGKLAVLGGECLVETLDRLAEDTITPKKQDDKLATYASKISKEEALIDWNTSAVELERMIRAFNPAPVAHTVLQGTAVRIWEADIIDTGAVPQPPGRIIDISADGIVVAAAHDALRIRRLQLPGRKATSVRDFLNGHPDLLEPE